MNLEILEKIGLSQNEIKVYFALIEMSQTTTTPHVKKAEIPNTKVYPPLDKLIKKGLVSFVVKNKIKHFGASDPHNLIEFIKEKENELSKQKAKIEELLPLIELRRKENEDNQEAIVYEGYDGIKSAFNDILNSLKKGETYYVFTLGKELFVEQLKYFFASYHNNRIEKGINVKLIAKKELKKDFAKSQTFKGMKFKYTNFHLPTGIFIYKNKVMTLVWGDKPTAFVISSKNNFEKYKEFFEDMWRKSS